PSAWIEPKGDWGKGTVDLVEIPTADETNDNIVAFWKPETQPEPGQAIDFNYRLHWTMDEDAIHSPDLGWVKQTLRSTGDVKQSNLIRQPDGSVAYLVDFVGPTLAKLGEDPAIRSQVTTDENTELVENNLRYNPVTKGWRLTLRMKIKDANKSVEMRAYLLRETPAEPGKEPAVITADKSDKKPEKKADAKLAAPKEAEIVKTDAVKAGDVKDAKVGKADAKDAAKADAGKGADAAKVAEAKTDEASKPEAALGDAAKANKGSKETQQPAVEAASTQQGPAMNQQVLTETWSYQLPADE
ncbi:MAG TPA: glucan biosynthesis protein, partial [Pseudomonas sp.]|nr:glucan biosynthesis protein [Pseudomonas sp.]